MDICLLYRDLVGRVVIILSVVSYSIREKRKRLVYCRIGLCFICFGVGKERESVF